MYESATPLDVFDMVVHLWLGSLCHISSLTLDEPVRTSQHILFTIPSTAFQVS